MKEQTITTRPFYFGLEDRYFFMRISALNMKNPQGAKRVLGRYHEYIKRKLMEEDIFIMQDMDEETRLMNYFRDKKSKIPSAYG